MSLNPVGYDWQIQYIWRMSITDAQIGKNLAKLRGNMSQADLADAMKDRGFKWSQATVWSVEKGERPLRLTESEHVSEILDCSIHHLTTSGPYSAVQNAMGEVSRARGPLEEALKTFMKARYELALQAAVSEHTGGQLPSPLRDSVIGWLNLKFDDVVAQVWIAAEGEMRLSDLALDFTEARKEGVDIQEYREGGQSGEALESVFLDLFTQSLGEVANVSIDLASMPTDSNAESDVTRVEDDADTEIHTDGVKSTYGLAASKRRRRADEPHAE